MSDESTQLVCKFTGEITKEGDRHVVEIPETEIEYGTLTTGEVVQISVETTDLSVKGTTESQSTEPQPPVSEGDRLTVEIEDVGDQGDGIARVDRGYVLIVPETEPGDRVEIEVKQTNSNYGFAHVVESETENSEADQEVRF